MNKNKIVAINCNHTSGGGKVMLGVGEIARLKGFDYYTFSPSIKLEPPLGHNYMISRFEKYINREFSELTGYDNTIVKSATKKIVRILSEIKPDIIHLHGLHGWYIDYKLLFRYIEGAGIPVIWAQHDCWAFTGKCTHFSSVNCYKWIDKCYSCPQLNQYPKSKFINNSEYMYKYKKKVFTSYSNINIVSVSKWLESTLKKSYLNTFPVQTIENGVDRNVFKFTQSDLRSQYKINDKFIVLGVAASWNDRKGLNDFIKLRKSLPEYEYEIVLIGLNSKQCDSVHEKGIIGIKKTTSKKELAEWYSVVDVFLNPSIEETFGLVTAEAMACGSPVIVYNSTASPELIENTDNYCVEPNNIEEVIKCIYEIQNRGRDFFTNTNILRVSEHYDQQKQYEKYIQLYRQILQTNKSKKKVK